MRWMWLLALLPACLKPPVATTTTTVVQDTPIRVSQNTQSQVDILFMVDNSQSMDAMQAELIAKFPTFLDVFDALAHPTDPKATPQYADLHIGVVTSDYGAGDVAGSGCDASPGGQKGLLQAKGAAAAASCGTPMGASYIAYAFGKDKDTCNLASGCTPAALGAQFTCMASVGAMGCGFEHQLESVYAALSNGANAGFLRQDAILAVVFVTNEDDGSASPQVTFYDPKATNAGAYTTYRQTRFGISCGGMPAPEGDSGGSLTTCDPTTPCDDTTEYCTSRYTDLFTKPGMLKGDPTNDIVLVAIDPPTSPFATVLATTNTGNGKAPNPSYVPCSAPSDSCIVALQHSCQNAAEPAFFGDPPLRLDAVVSNQHLHQSANICGDDLTKTPDYSAALQKVASLISSTLAPGCIPAPLPDPTKPDCTVEDITTQADGTTKQSSIQSCVATNGSLPCWKVASDSRCNGVSPQGLLVEIDRPIGYTVPPNTTARVECSTKACPADTPDC